MNDPSMQTLTAVVVGMLALFLKETIGLVKWVIEKRNGKSSNATGNPGPDSSREYTDALKTLAATLERMRQEYLYPMKTQQQELHTWHDVSDAEGVKLWYGRSLMRPLEKLAESIGEQTGILKELLIVQRATLEVTRKNGK